MGIIGVPEVFLIGIVAIVVIFCISYLSSLHQALKAVSPENRKMKPVNVWLLCIPAFNILYLFTVVDAIASSFKQEYDKYGAFGNTKSLQWLGISIGVLNILAFFWGIAGIASLMCLVLHWIRVNQCKKEILQLHENARLGEGEKSIFL